MNRIKTLLHLISDAFSDQEDPSEPFYDPVHVGGTIVITLTVMGCLYWLLWTLLVYEGGVFLKLQCLAQALFTKTTLTDLGYEGYPYAMGKLEGIIGNFAALFLCLAVLAALHHAYLKASRKHRDTLR